ncbi:MAG TPA: DUF58 domain-containing protein [Trebonia sp.]|jgi:uncharacterized protein (DUF58 family)|nr:DUF58 domain-containing protein [Trebonia sp.]
MTAERPEPGAAAQPVFRADASVQWRVSRHSRRLLTLALAALLLALVTRRPELAGLAAPALLLLAAGSGRATRPAWLLVEVRPSATRLIEAEPATIGLTVAGQAAAPGARPGAGGPAAVADGLVPLDSFDLRWTFHPGKGIEPASATAVGGRAPRFALTVPRWGKRQAGTAELVLRDRWRVTEGRVLVTLPSLDCFPRPGQQEATITLSRLPNRLGEHPARVPGDGLEFAGIREYVPGDRQRQINWPASTRLGRLQVNTYAAERAQDVVLLVDATSDVGEPGTSALDFALRGASAAARAYLRQRDRVGAITYQWGGAQWLAPALGKRQEYRIIDALLRADASWSRGANVRRLPRAALPDGALVVAFSPLLDQRFVEALRDMRERGLSLLVVDVLNVSPPASRRDAVSPADRLARRIWSMEQQAIRFALRELGVPVVHWDGTAPLDLPLAPFTRRPLVGRR